jgi:hypothetical protein
VTRRGFLLAATILGCAAATGCGGSARSTQSSASATSTPPPAVTAATPRAVTTAAPPVTTSTPKPRPRPRPKPNPGSLPQTDQLPSAGTPAFHAEMAALWKGIQTESLRAAVAAFFPEGAYAQVKQIADPQADYTGRLLADYHLDLIAAHQLIGGTGAGAHLLDVRVPPGYAHWVSPGACDNRVGYYEFPNSRMVYSENGVVRSFGIASMISWRGVWYVVHLGSVLRPAALGLVDDPSAGPGGSAPSSTC